MVYFIVRVILLALLSMVPQAGGATGIMPPDLGLDKAFVVIFEALAVALVLWAVLRITPFWRARLKSNPGLAVLGMINPLLLLVVIAASWVSFSFDSWLLLVPMFLGAPLAVLGIVVELIWGFMINPSDQGGHE